MLFKTFYLILGVTLSLGAAYLLWRRIEDMDGGETSFAITFCSLVGALCFALFFNADKLKNLGK